MTDVNNTSTTPTPRHHWYRPRNILLASAVVLASATGGAVLAQGFGQGFGPGGFGGPMMMGHMMGRMDPAFIEDRADRAVRHLAVEIDATNEQQDKLRAIVKAAVKDLVPMHAKADAAREKAHALLTQPTVNRADIEGFRTEQMQAIDGFTKRVAQALGDASDVLSLEQRKKLDELIAARRATWQGWHHG